MRRIIAIEMNGPDGACDVVRLDYDQRSRRRMVFTTAGGASILLDMPRPVRLTDGHWLQLDDGEYIHVEAMAEALVEIVAASDEQLVRIAWHLGNRHLPTQLLPGPNGGALRIRHDHVITDMVEGLGGICTPVLAPFDPEGGAYQGQTATQGHDHHHHDHHRDHAHG